MTCKKQAEAQPIDGLAIVKETSTLGKLIIKGVPKEEAKRMIVENHYSHKWNEGASESTISECSGRKNPTNASALPFTGT